MRGGDEFDGRSDFGQFVMWLVVAMVIVIAGMVALVTLTPQQSSERVHRPGPGQSGEAP